MVADDNEDLIQRRREAVRSSLEAFGPETRLDMTVRWIVTLEQKLYRSRIHNERLEKLIEGLRKIAEVNVDDGDD